MPVDQISLYEFIGKRLQKKRVGLGMTQFELAQQAKLSRTSIANIEGGNQNAPLHVIYDLCLILGIKPSEIFPNFEEITSPIEVADAIAQKMAGEGSDKAANVVRNLVRTTREDESSGNSANVQKQGRKTGRSNLGDSRQTSAS